MNDRARAPAGQTTVRQWHGQASSLRDEPNGLLDVHPLRRENGVRILRRKSFGVSSGSLRRFQAAPIDDEMERRAQGARFMRTCRGR